MLSTLTNTKRTWSKLLLISMTIGLSACSSISNMFEHEEEIPLEGDRISVLELEKKLEPNNISQGSSEIIIPQAWRNEFWPQSGGYPNHAMQHLMLNDGELHRIWKTSIGRGAVKRYPLTATPIVFDETIVTLDTKSRLAAFNKQSGKQLWKTDVRNEDDDEVVIGGGVAYSGQTLFVTSGYGEVLAIAPDTGDILWRKSLPSPARAAPTIVNGRIFVATLDSRLLSLSAEDGSILWDYTGIPEIAGLIGAASPAANHNIVVPAFSSGEITALRIANGSIAWTETLSNTRSLGGLGAISDIKALPIIDNGMIIAVSFAGRLVAIDERTGMRIWQKEISSTQTPWVVGNHIFVVSSENQLIALERETGTIRWITDFPKTDGHKILNFMGPVLAGNRLIIAGSNGMIYEVSPDNGDTIREWDFDRDINLPPIVAGNMLYILGKDGTLAAYQ